MKFTFVIAMLWCFQCLVSTEDASLLRAEDIYRNYNITPDIIQEAPKYILEVSYPNETKVSLGNELTPTQVKSDPEVKWEALEDAKYTLVMSDPDALDGAGVLHWMIVNIPGSNVRAGKIQTEYVGSGPPKNTGRHRYIFTVFKQEGELNLNEPYTPFNSREGRLGFSLKKFTEKYHLGEPLAGNFYLAQYDDYVPILHMQFVTGSVPPQPVGEFIKKSSTDSETSTTSETVHLQSHRKTRFPIKPSTEPTEEASKDGHNKTTIDLSQTTDDLTTVNPTVGDSLPSSLTPISDYVHTTESTLSIDKMLERNDKVGLHSGKVEATTVVHDHQIRVSYISNDSVIHTKALSEDQIHENSEHSTVETTTGFLHNKAIVESSDSPVHTRTTHTDETTTDSKDSKTIVKNGEPIKEIIPSIHLRDEEEHKNEKKHKEDVAHKVEVTTHGSRLNQDYSGTTLQKYDEQTTPATFVEEERESEPSKPFISDILHEDIKEDPKDLERDMKEILNKKKEEGTKLEEEKQTQPSLPEISTTMPGEGTYDHVDSFKITAVKKGCPTGQVPDFDGTCQSTNL